MNEMMNIFFENVEFYKNNAVYDKQLMTKLTNYYSKFIEKVAYFKQQKTNTPVKEDLIQDGILGLYAAVKNYKDDKNIQDRKAQFCDFYIKRFIVTYINKEFNDLRNLFKKKTRLAIKLKKYYKEIESKNITIEQLAKKLDTTEFEIMLIIEGQKSTLSLETSNDDDDSSEEIYKSNTLQQDNFLDLKNIHETLNQISSDLNLEERERDILVLLMKNGDVKNNNDKINSEYPSSFADIAEKYSVSRERIRQLSEKVKEKIKRELLRNKITKDSLLVFEM